MTPDFVIIAVVLVLSAIAAMSLRNLVHCALCLSLTFASLAALYLQLGAEFVGFAQILVYIGAVAILIVFAILLTRSSDTTPQTPIVSSAWWMGLGVAVATWLCLSSAIKSSNAVPKWSTLAPEITVKMIGAQLLDRPESKPDSYVLPLLVTGVLLTAALIGAVIIAMQERKDP